MKENVATRIGSISLYGMFAFFIGLLGIDVYILFATEIDVSINRLYFLALVSLLFLAAAGLPWERGRKVLRSTIFVGLFVEALLQIIALGGWLPGTLSVYRHVPYGRVYFTSEGFSNSVMNRYGWHAPEFTFRNNARRIAVIGDSFVEAVQVHPRDTLPVKLAGRLESIHPGVFEVIGLGNSGHGPAQYLEFIRYAHEQFGINEAIVMVFAGNDFRNLLRSQISQDPGYAIYHHYDLDNQGNLVLSAEDQAKRQNLHRRLARNHEPLVMNLTTVIGQHLFIRHIGQDLTGRIGERWAARMAMGKQKPKDHASNQRIAGGAGDWYDGFVFQRPKSADARKAFGLARGVFTEMKVYADANQIKLRVVSIPHFPSWWYKQQGRPWNRQVKSFDLGQPESELRSILGALGIPYLEVGKEWEIAQQDPELIKSFYSFGGTGHFTTTGHDHFARLIAGRFYTSGP